MGKAKPEGEHAAEPEATQYADVEERIFANALLELYWGWVADGCPMRDAEQSSG